jgi:hypothetical protein
VEDRAHEELRSDFRRRLRARMDAIGEPPCTIDPPERGAGGDAAGRY